MRSGLGAFGLGGGDPAPARAVVRAEERLAEGRFALSVLAGALGGVYVASGASLLGRLTASGLLLIAVGLAEAALGAAGRRFGRSALWVAATLNALLFIQWGLDRTVGAQPIGVLDGLCAADAMVIATLAYLCARAPRAGLLSQPAILLAVLTVSALLGGHTHTAAAATTSWPGGAGGAGGHLYCRLL
jgi:hypothetical protein